MEILGNGFTIVHSTEEIKQINSLKCKCGHFLNLHASENILSGTDKGDIVWTVNLHECSQCDCNQFELDV